MSSKSKKSDYVIIEGPIRIIDVDIEKEKEKIKKERRLNYANILNTRNNSQIR